MLMAWLYSYVTISPNQSIAIANSPVTLLVGDKTNSNLIVGKKKMTNILSTAVLLLKILIYMFTRNCVISIQTIVR